MIRHNIVNNGTVADQYIEAVLRLKDPVQYPWPGQNGLSMYDFFVFWHYRSMMLMTPPPPRANPSGRNAAHNGPVFLPWHRYMLIMFEFYLRQVLADDNFRLPYWDSTADAALPDPTRAPIWDDALLGQFEGSSWQVRLEPLDPQSRNATPRLTNRRLVRELGSGGALPSRDELRALLQNEDTYDVDPYNTRSRRGFRNAAELIHNAVHTWVMGDMVLATSPNDPVFFLHHCNVDRIWAIWQQSHPTDYAPDGSASSDLQFHRLDDPMHTFFNHRVTPRQMLDFSAWYTYDTLTV